MDTRTTQTYADQRVLKKKTEMVAYQSITSIILKAFYEVYHELGYGFLENVYQNALYKELMHCGLKCEVQQKIEVFYKEEPVGVYYADILVEGIIILELKAVNELHPAHEAQLMNYLKATHIEVGLLLNFGPEPTFKQKIFSRNNKE